MMMTETEVRLPRPPGVIRRALAAHPLAVDVFIVSWYFIGIGIGILLDVLTSVEVFPGQIERVPLSIHLQWPWWPVTALLVIAVGGALLFRRKYPLTGLLVTLAVSFGIDGGMALANGVAVLFMIYAVPVYRSVRAGWLGYAAALLVAIAQIIMEATGVLVSGTGPGALVVSSDPDLGPGETLLTCVMTAVWYLAILMLGINLGNRRRYVEAIIDRAHQLARERDQLAQLAVAEERSRIAREMHDIVAHSVSVMIALSEGASRAVDAAPDAAADAMRRSAETGRTALAEMRRLLGALHSSGEGAELVPQPGMSELPGLVESFREAGLRVGLSISGDGSGDRGQELAVYRIVQEGLTNVLRYAGTGSRSEVRVWREDRRAIVEVRDFGRPEGGALPVTGVGSGRGLAGLAERARVFGGRIESGPVPPHDGGGWRLWAEIPVSTDARVGGAPPNGAVAGSDAGSQAMGSEQGEGR